ncbi:MAG: hypothetical protein ACE5E6_02315, partial [Phycisphaerae bacterium]
DELPADEIECVRADRPRAGRAAPRIDGRLPDDIGEWGVGTLVRHPLHGLGRIVSFHRGPRRTHVNVEFQAGPSLAWVLEFADLERVAYDEVG